MVQENNKVQPEPDDIVISGMAGSLPGSKNIDEFEEKIYNKLDLTSPSITRGFNHPDVPPNMGFIPSYDRFDAGFFGIHRHQANQMDPQYRLSFEKALEAIYDAGMHPSEFENTNTGIFAGFCVSESEALHIRFCLSQDSLIFTGHARSLLAQRLSYFLKTKGPCFNIDTACSSSLFALEHAYQALKQGQCDRAIVIGVNLCFHPGPTIQFFRLGVLSPTGVCCPFDESGNGYVRSDAVCAVVLQKAKDARRIYAQLVHAKINCDGFKDEGITYPSGQTQTELLREFYEECKIPPTSLSYLEAHGTGTKVGDPEECQSIDTIFATNRDQPLLMGSVKSSIGHTEGASGLASVIKCILALEKELISPNLNFKKPKDAIRGIVEGRMTVVSQNTKFQDDRKLIGINSFGFGGANCHVLLRGFKKTPLNNRLQPIDNLPRLVCLSGRTHEAVDVLLDEVFTQKLDNQQIYLLHHLFRKKFTGHQYKGYIIMSKKGEISRSISYGNLTEPHLCLAFGELNNWYETIKNFRELPLFQQSLQRIEKVLAKKSVNLENTVLNNNADIRKTFNLLGQISVHICMSDLLKEVIVNTMENVANFFGRLISAYNDKQLTLDEILEFALGHGDDNKYTEFSGNATKGSITNGHHVNELKQDPSNEHIISEWRRNNQVNKIITTKEKLLGKIQTILHEEETKKYFSSEKIVTKTSINNIINLQPYSVLLEVGNNNFVCEEENVTRLTSQDSLEDFLKSIGSLYQLGYEVALEKLYPKIEFPIIKAPGLHSKILWNHSYQHVFTTIMPKVYQHSFCIDIKKSEWSYIAGHNIDGRILFPAAGYLYLTWELVAKTYQDTAEVPILFEDCKFIRATSINQKEPVTLKVTINNNGRFEITEGDALVVTGKVSVTTEDEQVPDVSYDTDNDRKVLTAKDVYKELRLRGYNYSGLFRSIKTYDTVQNVGTVAWSSNFVTFLDNLFQLKILQTDTRLLYVPTSLKKLKILPKAHFKIVRSDEENELTELPAVCNPKTDIIRSGGIEVHGLQASSIQRKKNVSVPVLERYEFVPNDTKLSIEQSVRVNTQIILENLLQNKMSCLEIVDGNAQMEPVALTPTVLDVLDDQPTIRADFKVYCKQQLQLQGVVVENSELGDTANEYSLVIARNLLQKSSISDKVLKAIKTNGFVISREPPTVDLSKAIRNDIVVLTVHRSQAETLVLFTRTTKNMKSVYISIKEDYNFGWIPEVQSAIKTSEKTVLYAENEPENGLLGFVNCLRREPDVNSNVSCVLVLDKTRPFQPNDAFYGNQLSKNMAVNIYKDGCWGTYRHLRLDECENVSNEHCYVNQTVKGDLSSLRWMEGPIVAKECQNVCDKTLVNVHYAALNFRDVMLASGKIAADVITTERIEQECVLGFEFSGIETSGQRVMGMIPQGALSTMVQADPDLLWDVPKQWSLEEAATVPAVYGTVIYALDVRANMQKGNSILIHSGVGGVGQAAIRYALHAGCTVFTTVGNDQKIEYLRKVFPQLPRSHIGNSHDLTFEKLIMRNTRGKGVDIVLNSLAEEKLLASVRCLAKGGKFLEIGKFDISLNNSLNLMLLKKNCSFHGVMLDKLFKSSPMEKRELVYLVEKGIRNGSVKPLDRTIFGYDDVEQAFRYMAGGKHMGKVLVEVCRTESKPQLFEGIPRYYCDPKKSYILIGGLGGFGLELADWLVLRGAKNLILVSRNGIQNGYQKTRVKTWMNYGVTVQISKADVSKHCGCRQLIEDAQALGPVGAVFNLAAVLEDAIFENQTAEKFKISLTPKALTTKYFDELTRKMCPDLTDFVVFSSVSCGRGNPGQTNYGMANSVMERICEERRKAGYPALAIEWGAIGEVGLVAEMQVENIEIEISGTLQQRISSCLQVMDLFLRQKSAALVSSMVVAEKKNKADATTLVEAVASVLGITDLKAVSHNSTLAEIGMDSMTAVEIKQLLETDFEVFLTPKEIRVLTLARLEEIESGGQEEVQDKDAAKSTQINLIDPMDCYKGKKVFNVPIVKMPSNVREDQEAPTVLLIPGLEGFSEILGPICKRMNAHTYALQVNYDDVPETIFDMAQQISPYVERHISKNKKFTILGYSYGCGVALELISILETRGYSGTLISVDGSPIILRQNVQELYTVLNSQQVEDVIISDVLKTYGKTPELSNECLAECRNYQTTEEKLEITKKITQDQLLISTNNFELLVRGLLKRVTAIRYYTPSFNVIKSNVILCKTTYNNFNTNLEDYGLSELCQQKVEVKIYEGNHHTILENEDLFDDINEML